MKRNNSPCIDACDFSGKNNWCLGCGRTRNECTKWKQMKPFVKTRLLNELKRRMITLNA